MPTSPQAEVLVKDCVPWHSVRRIVVSSDHSLIRARGQLPSREHRLLKVNRKPFEQRSDWRLWRDAVKPAVHTGMDPTLLGDQVPFDDSIPF
jgi:hypothetical protein